MSTIEFITIDLDIASNNDISSLVEELSTHTIFMHYEVYNDGSHNASFESHKGTIEDIIDDFYTVIKNLRPTSKIMWDKCFKRSFNIGFNSGLEPYSIQSSLSNELLRMIADVEGSLEITIYQVIKDEK